MDAITEILLPVDGHLGWVALRWPLSDAVTITVDGIDSCLRIEPDLLHGRETLMTSLLSGENLLPNAGFDDRLAYWETLDGCGVDYNASTCLSDGHVAYIRRKSKHERDATRLYSDPIVLPAGNHFHRYWLSGHLAYHRCSGHLGVEWLDATGSTLGVLKLEPGRLKAWGGAQIESFDYQSALLDAPTDAVSARLFLEKSLTQPGKYDSFLFFTRLFFGPAERAPASWKPMDAAYLERAHQFASSADYFQPLIYECLQQAESATRDGHWALAIDLLYSILNVDATGVTAGRAHACLADVLCQLGDLNEAEATLSAGVERFPESRELLIAAAEMATARQDWVTACSRWGQILDPEIFDLPARLYLQYSIALCRQQRYGEAEQLIAACLKQDPNDSLLTIAYAEIAMARHSWSEATTRWKGVL